LRRANFVQHCVDDIFCLFRHPPTPPASERFRRADGPVKTKTL
jgi:hypothetical protein